MKTKPVTLTIKEDIIEKGKKKAIEQHRSFSNYVEWLIINDFERGEKK
jgi:hypothetical protein